MKPNRVPEDLIKAGFAAIRAWREEHPGPNAYLDDRTEMRLVLAAVLTIRDEQVEQLVRERIALSLERASNQQDQDAERYADERSPLLRAQAEALWDAALAVRSGDEDGSEEAGDSVIAKLSEGVVTVPPGTPIPDELLIAMNGGGRVERGGQEAAHG